MDEYKGQEKRRSVRKEVFLSIKLIAKDTIVSMAQMLDMSCYGIRLEIMFMTNEEKEQIENIFAKHTITLEIGEMGGVFHIKVPVDIQWSAYKSNDGVNIFEVGMDLILTEEQKKEWQQFYNSLYA